VKLLRWVPGGREFKSQRWPTGSLGAPSFVSEPPGDALVTFPEARRSTERYIRNLALWLDGAATPSPAAE